jgi:hypothetical protein
MKHRAVALVGALSAAVLALGGCASADPFKAQASVAAQGLDAAGDAQATGALENSSMAVRAWQAANGRFPSDAEFATIDGAAKSGGTTVMYHSTATGFCLSATSSTTSKVTRVYREPGGLQPAGATC